MGEETRVAKVHFLRNQSFPRHLHRRRTAARQHGESELDYAVRLLVVEDDQLIQAIVEEALAEGGFQLAITPSW